MTEQDWATENLETVPPATDTDAGTETAVRRLQERSGELTARPGQPVGVGSELETDDDAAVSGEPETYYPTCYQWLVATWRRPLNPSTATWCPQWWKHPEAVSRVESLWRAWEQLRLDAGTGMSVWWRDHADHHLPLLLATDGPFKGCGPEKGHTVRAVPALTVEPPPGELVP